MSHLDASCTQGKTPVHIWCLRPLDHNYDPWEKGCGWGEVPGSNVSLDHTLSGVVGSSCVLDFFSYDQYVTASRLFLPLIFFKSFSDDMFRQDWQINIFLAKAWVLIVVDSRFSFGESFCWVLIFSVLSPFDAQQFHDNASSLAVHEDQHLES